MYFCQADSIFIQVFIHMHIFFFLGCTELTKLTSILLFLPIPGIVLLVHHVKWLIRQYNGHHNAKQQHKKKHKTKQKRTFALPCGKNLLTKTFLLFGWTPEILHCIREFFFSLSLSFFNILSLKTV